MHAHDVRGEPQLGRHSGAQVALLRSAPQARRGTCACFRQRRARRSEWCPRSACRLRASRARCCRRRSRARAARRPHLRRSTDPYRRAARRRLRHSRSRRPRRCAPAAPHRTARRESYWPPRARSPRAWRVRRRAAPGAPRSASPERTAPAGACVRLRIAAPRTRSSRALARGALCAVPHIEPDDALAALDRATALGAERDDAPIGFGAQLDRAIRLRACAHDDLARDRSSARDLHGYARREIAGVAELDARVRLVVGLVSLPMPVSIQTITATVRPPAINMDLEKRFHMTVVGSDIAFFDQVRESAA